jgi:hypothetical protein
MISDPENIVRLPMSWYHTLENILRLHRGFDCVIRLIWIEGHTSNTIDEDRNSTLSFTIVDRCLFDLWYEIFATITFVFCLLSSIINSTAYCQSWTLSMLISTYWPTQSLPLWRAYSESCLDVTCMQIWLSSLTIYDTSLIVSHVNPKMISTIDQY